MATRRERVVLELQDDFTTGMAQAAAAAALLHHELDQLGSVNLNTSTSVNHQIGQLNTNANQASSSINQLTGRLGLAGDAILTLGAGVIPLGAVGAQAIGGLTTSVAALAIAGGSAIVAFQGIADATKAIDDYQLDPTVANLEKAQEAMARLSPDAGTFVAEFQKLQPTLSEIKSAAARGWFPGLTRSLSDFEDVAPKVARLFELVGQAGGEIAEDVAGSLASGRYDKFLRFLKREAPAAMTSLARTTGDLTHGFSEMWIAFDPGNDRFFDWLESVGDGFDRWASSSEGRDDIQGFLEYARESGPEVKEFFLALVDATAQIAQAAAPLGGTVLSSLTKLLEVVADIAGSDLGTPFLTALIAMRAYSRLMTVIAAQQARFAATPMGGGAVAGGAAAIPFVGATTTATANLAAQQQALAAQRAARLSAIGRGAGLAAGFGLLSSGAADDIGMTNAALLTLTGTMAGPYGAAAGAMVGTFLDIRANASATQDTLSAFNDVLAAGVTSYQDLQAAAEAQGAAADDYMSNFDSVGSAAQFLGTNPAEGWGLLGDSLDGNIDRLASYADAATKADGTTVQLGRNLMEVARALGDTTPITAADLMAPDAERIQGIIHALLPDLANIGVSLEDVATASPTELRGWINELTNLNGEVLTSTNLLKGWTLSLQAAQGFLSRQGAMDAYQSMLNSVNDTIKENGRTLDKNTDKGLANREMLRGLAAQGLTFAEQIKDKGKRRTFISQLEDDLRSTAKEFNASPKWINNFLDKLNFPEKKKLKLGMDTTEVDDRTKHVRGQLDDLDRRKTTLRVGMDAAPFEGGRRKVEQGASLIERLNPTPKVDMFANQFFSGAAGVRAEANRLDALHPTIDVTVTTTRVTRVMEQIGGRVPSADGGSVPKTGLPYADRHPYLLADGEEIISNRFGQADAFRADRAAGRIPGYADGGTTGMGAPGALTNGMSPWSSDGINGMNMAAGRAAMALKGLNARLKESESALAKEQDQRRTLIDQGRSAFLTDPLAQSTDIWGGGAAGNPLAVLQNDIRNATQFQQLIKKLDKRGLGGAALGEVDSLQEAQLLASMSPSDLRRYEELYKQRQRVATSAGVALAEGSGATVAEIRRLRAEVKGLRGDIKREEKQNRDNRDKNHDKDKDGRREAARRARQRQQRNPKP